jgi:hypothetical protein
MPTSKFGDLRCRAARGQFGAVSGSLVSLLVEIPFARRWRKSSRIAAHGALNSVFYTQVKEAVPKDGPGGIVRVEKGLPTLRLLGAILHAGFRLFLRERGHLI